MSRVVFYHVLSNVKPKRSMSACSKVALIGKHIILINFFDFPGRRKPPPRHASTPFCGVAMLMLPFNELEVPSSERRRTHITFQYFSLFKTSLDSQTEHSAGRTELSGVFCWGMPMQCFLCDNYCKFRPYYVRAGRDWRQQF